MLRGAAVAAVVLALAGVASAEVSAPRPQIRLVRIRLVDHTRRARLRNGTVEPRVLVTYVRYPGQSRSPLPLVVFGHGFAGTPGRYDRLLDAWARAGFVVAAPLFPVENANAPGGPDESDLVNQPGDIRFVVTRLLAASDRTHGALHGLIDPAEIAVAGHSDGAETAFAVAEERRYRDPRIRAAVILSGAVLPGGGPVAGPPLLAVQGTGDTVNPPRFTHELFGAARRPRFLLSLLGAGHLPPYTTNRRQLTVVERVSIAFLDRYLRHGSLRRILAAARAPGVARLTAEP